MLLSKDYVEPAFSCLGIRINRFSVTPFFYLVNVTLKKWPSALWEHKHYNLGQNWWYLSQYHIAQTFYFGPRLKKPFVCCEGSKNVTCIFKMEVNFALNLSDLSNISDPPTPIKTATHRRSNSESLESYSELHSPVLSPALTTVKHPTFTPSKNEELRNLSTRLSPSSANSTPLLLRRSARTARRSDSFEWKLDLSFGKLQNISSPRLTVAQRQLLVRKHRRKIFLPYSAGCYLSLNLSRKRSKMRAQGFKLPPGEAKSIYYVSH